MSDDDDVQIIDDNINYRSITCERIPDLFLDKLVAKMHFGKFGKISRFILRPNRFCCTVDYEREEDAANAIENGAVFNGHEFDIHYSQREVGHVQNTEEWVDPDVQAELDAMGNHTRRLPMPSVKLPPPAIRTVKPKPQKPTVPDIQVPQTAKVPIAVKSELEAILRKPAYTDEDRYRLLDARDKLIRLTTVRTTDIKKVVSIKGTCPDMCPEKERYMREFQHQVSVFEMEEGGSRNEMNHNTAVKEYSRSSADQEVPLAHELRPEPVLKMTMQYLMHRIMGLCDDEDINLGDWFHFVWDRTRSIRKDITQQELCSVGAVQLVEQCARFHIHCAARLVAEDPSVFDQKINTENLTKCLQTLKYMYNDLRIKGTRCEREAEFRGYIVLLNLNDANFLWELQQLPEEIQNSQEVRSAIGFYKCMESNNYVRFFNLVRETTYMNACILLRYFTQVRLKAIKMIIKAYNWPRHMVSLPLSYLTKILGFENEDAAAEFFSYYGLECGQNGVSLDKNAFEEPDIPVLMDRAFELVESKRQVVVGEAICSESLDSPSIFESHKPHNSFDQNGYLRYEIPANEERQNLTDNRQTPPRSLADNVFKVPKSSAPVNPKQQLKSIFASVSVKSETPSSFTTTTSSTTKSLFGQKLDVPVTTNSTTTFIFKIPLPAAPSQGATKTSSSIFGMSSFQPSSNGGPSIFARPANVEEPAKSTKNIFGPLAQSFSNDNVFQHFGSKPLELNLIKPSVPDPQLEQQKELERQRQQQEEQKRRKAQEEEEQAKQRQREEQERLQRSAEEQKRLEHKRKQAAIARVAENSQRILNEIVTDVVARKVSEIASNELKKVQQLEKLTEQMITEFITDFIRQVHSEEITIIRRDQSLLYKYFHTWREIVYKKKTQRDLLHNMSVCMITDTLEEQADKFACPRQDDNLQMIRRYRLGYPCDFKALLDDEESLSPIDISSCIRRYYGDKQDRYPTGFLRRRKYFKLVISLPGEREELPGFNSYANSWLEKNVEPKRSESTSAFVCHCESDLALCVRKVSCISRRNERDEQVKKECDHPNAVLFFMSAGNLSNTRKRLHHLFKLSVINSAIPLVVLVYRNEERPLSVDSLELESLVDNEKVSNYRVIYSDDSNLLEDFQESLRFLVENNNFSCPLEAQDIIPFLDRCLGDELWQRFHKSTNPSFRKVCSMPRYLVAVYNEAIDRMIDIIDDDFRDYPEFPEELRQFVPKNKFDIPVSLEQFPENWKDTARARKLVEFLTKLKLPPVDVELPQEIGDLELWILNYTSACIPDDNTASTKTGYSAIKCLIMTLNSESFDDDPLVIRLQLISWLPIVRQIALGVLNHRWSTDGSKLFPEVIYNREELHEFHNNPWWLESAPVKAVKMTAQADESNSEETENPEDTIEEIIARGERASTLADDKLKQLQHKANSAIPDPELTRDLDETLYNFEVNEKCKSFESAMLSLSDDDDSLEAISTPKRFKQGTDKLSPQQIMERAFSILRKAEDFMDIFREPPTD